MNTATMGDDSSSAGLAVPTMFPGGIDIATGDARYLLKNAPQISATDFLQLGGGNPATAGGVRFPNGASVMWRNSANTGNIGIRVKGGDVLATDAGSVYPAQIDMFVTAGGMQVLPGGAVVISGDPGITTYPLRVNGGMYASHCAVSTGGAIWWNGRAQMQSPADGVITLLNAAASDFTRQQYGGASAAFPAWRRNGAKLDAVLADNSGFTTVNAANLVAQAGAASNGAGTFTLGSTTAATVGAAGGAAALPATPLGYLIVFVGVTQVKIPYYNN